MADEEFASATSPFCVWAQASRSFAIHIPADVIASLGTESLVAFKRVPRRGLETGGILLGRTEVLDELTTFFIEGFAPIESEHRFGPSYVLSDSDFEHLQSELTRNGTASIGIYRSQTRTEELAIQDADVGLFEKCFGVSDALFLMLAPAHRRGAFYFREDGNLKCVHQFTVVSSLSAHAAQGRNSSPHENPAVPPSLGIHNEHANIAKAAANQASAAAVAGEGSDQNAPRQAVSASDPDIGDTPYNNPGVRRASETYGVWMSAIRTQAATLWSEWSGLSSGIKLTSRVLGAVTLVVLTASLLTYSFRRSAAPPDHRAPSYLNLAVEPAGPALRLLWDGNSSAVRGATRAVLHIQDGDQQSDWELAPSELIRGYFTFQPRQSAVTFRLNVYAAELNAIGMIQVMPPPSQVAAAPSIEPIHRPAIRSRRSSHPVKPIVRTQAPGTQFAQTAQSIVEKDQNVAIEAEPPPVRAPDTAETSALAAREPSLPPRVEEAKQHSPNGERNDISTPARGVTVRALATPVPSSRWGRLFGKLLVGRSKKQAKAVEAVPAYQAQPIVRMPSNQPLDRPIAVGVKVYVGESGAVNEAEVVDYGDPLNLTLANAALAAAKNWTFEPSRVDDIPVASQVIIHFYFHP